MSNPFHEGYYLRAEGSNYTNYHWMPEATVPLAAAIKKLLSVKSGESVFEVGAARGYTVKALRMLGVEATGYDISDWAVENCDPEVKGLISTSYTFEPMSVDKVL